MSKQLAAALTKPSDLESQIESICAASSLAAVTRIKVIVANKDGYGPDQIRLILEQAQSREVRAKIQRPAVRQALRNAIKKLPAASGQVAMAEVLDKSVNIPTKPDPAWDNARLYFRAVKTTGRQFIVAQICLGWELFNRKQALGFTHGANKAGPSGQFGHTGRTWEEYLASEVDPDLARRTADRFIEVYQGFCEKCPKKIRVAFEGTGKRSLITTLSKPPSTLTEKDRQTVEAAITKCTDGETQRSLLEALRLVKVHTPLPGGDTTGKGKKEKPSDAELMGQLAFKFARPVTEKLDEFLSSKDRDAYLATLDIVSSDEDAISLTTLEVKLEASLKAVQAAKKDKLKTTTGKVIA